MSEATHADVAIIGAGFGGLGTAIRLDRAGFDSFLIFERANDVGGTWRDNSYPGCACDVPSHLCSYTFARNPRWSDTFSGQAEIWAYLRDCVDRSRIGPRLRLDHAVHQARWDETSLQWRLSTSQGSYTARVLISAPLSAPGPVSPRGGPLHAVLSGEGAVDASPHGSESTLKNETPVSEVSAADV
jgi:cation diffusion facilitator CzcD-associated flavoprotein CzcO